MIWHGGTEVEFQASTSAILSSVCLLTLGHNTITGHWFTYTEVIVSSTVVWIIFGSAWIFLTGQEKDLLLESTVIFMCSHVSRSTHMPWTSEVLIKNVFFPLRTCLLSQVWAKGAQTMREGTPWGNVLSHHWYFNCSGHVQTSACSTFLNTAEARRKAHNDFYMNAHLETAPPLPEHTKFCFSGLSHCTGWLPGAIHSSWCLPHPPSPYLLSLHLNPSPVHASMQVAGSNRISFAIVYFHLNPLGWFFSFTLH